MMEYLPINNNRLNQAAKTILLQKKQDADPGYLYVLQLARFVLQQRPELVPWPASKNIYQLGLNIDIMFGDPPSIALSYLLDQGMVKENKGNEEEAESFAVRHLDPEELISRLVDNLYENLASQIPTLRY